MTEQSPLLVADAPESTPVTCFGLTFETGTARRAYFREHLVEKLTAPTFRAIKGFPTGDDAAILALSDPPY